jgi:hypothetical protein
VLGLDDAMSRDHDWGCRLTLLVDEVDRPAIAAMGDLLARGLPERFRGHPVRFAMTWDETVAHQVQVATAGDFAVSRLGVNPLHGLSAWEWLTLTGQHVLEVVAGPVYADTTAELAAVRRALAWYPPDVELYVLACGWGRLAQRMPLMGRTAQTGQPLQSRLLSAALVGDLMSLAFLLHQRWQPYAKWREAMFARLPCAGEMAGPLRTAATAGDWRDRETALAAAIEVLAEVQRRRGLPTPAEAVAPYWDRPYRTVPDAVPDLLRTAISDPALAGLAVVAGSVEQWVDNGELLARPADSTVLTCAYRAWRDQAAGPG